MSLPQIVLTNRQYRFILSDVWTAVLKKNDPPELFMRAGRVTRLLHTEAGPKLEIVSTDAMFGIIINAADFATINARGNTIATKPTMEIGKTMVALPHGSLPAIEVVSSTPQFSPSGEMICTNGYNLELKTYYYGMERLTPPRGNRSVEQVAAAVRLLRQEVFGDFPFSSEGDFCHTIATLLLPFVRPLIRGTTPIHLIEANGVGSGKTLLADIITQIATGESLAPISPSDKEEEMRKKITSLLVEGKGIIVLDNLNSQLNSGVLASAITGARWCDRPLGLTKIVELPNNAVWIVTGNNPRMSLEVARRCIRVRLTPVGNAWERKVEAYKHPRILDWIATNRSMLVDAVYTLVRYWFQVGQPRPRTASLGSFESWVDIVGGILEAASLPGFLLSNTALYTECDPVSGEWEEFVSFWWGLHGNKWLSASEISLIAEGKDLLQTALGDGNPHSRRIRLGYALTARRDSYIGGYRIERRKDTTSKSVLYRLVGGSVQREISI